MARKPDVVVPMRRRPSMLDGVPEVEMPLAMADGASVRPVSDGPAIDLSGRPKVRVRPAAQAGPGKPHMQNGWSQE